MEAANENNNPNRITNQGGEVRLIEGPKAINAYRLRCLMLSIKLYLNTGMIPTRGVTISRMMQMVTDKTGTKYPRSRQGQEKALADIKALIESNVALEGVEIITKD